LLHKIKDGGGSVVIRKLEALIHAKLLREKKKKKGTAQSGRGGKKGERKLMGKKGTVR